MINNCVTYTEYACQNNFGADGKCYWNSNLRFCKLAECTDATQNDTAITTIAGC